jgi:hypothetical protein
MTKLYSIRNDSSFLNNRIKVKSFKYSDDMHKFLNKQYDNIWKIMKQPVKSGIYFEQYDSNSKSFNLIDIKRLSI